MRLTGLFRYISLIFSMIDDSCIRETIQGTLKIQRKAETSILSRNSAGRESTPSNLSQAV